MGLKRKLADRLGRALGLDISPAGSLGARMEEDFLRTLLERLSIDCVFDVGANRGQYARYLRSIGYAGQILSFEPGPEMVVELRAAATGDPKWEVFPIALGEERGTFAFNIMKMTEMSSFLQPTTDQSPVYAGINAIERIVDVEMTTVSTIFEDMRARFGFSRPFLKMDTQGFDLQVVRGAGDRIGQFLAIQSEVAVRNLYENSPHMLESLALYRELGFDLINIFKVHPGELMNPHEFNCYVLRRGMA